MIEKEKWFNVDAVKAKAEELWQAPCVHMRPDALEKYQKIFDKYNLPFSVYVQPAIVHIDVTGTFCLRLTEDNQEEFNAKYPERVQALNEFAMGLMAEGIVTLSGRRLYTSSAVTDEVVEETLEMFDRLFSSYAM